MGGGLPGAPRRHEFADLCRRVGAEPPYCVNFRSDGEKRYAATRESNRTGDVLAAADWVAYAKDPDHPERKAHGLAQPYGIRLWQLGNKTAYGGDSAFSQDQAIAITRDFRPGPVQRARPGGIGRQVLAVAMENPRQELSPLNPIVFQPRAHPLPRAAPFQRRFRARSVSVAELECQGA